LQGFAISIEDSKDDSFYNNVLTSMQSFLDREGHALDKSFLEENLNKIVQALQSCKDISKYHQLLN
jgi:hypothetical protein